MNNKDKQLRQSQARESLEDLTTFCEDNDITKADLLQIFYLHERLVNSMQDQKMPVTNGYITCKVLSQYTIKPVILI